MTHNDAVLFFRKEYDWMRGYPERGLTISEKKRKEAVEALELKDGISIADAMKVIKQHTQNTDCGSCEMRKNCGKEKGCPCFWEV